MSIISDSLEAYKLRDKIGKALKTRAEAIRRALEAYNTAASQLNPPREHLTWAKLMDTTTLAEFDLLRNSRQDVRQQPWSQPSHREAMNFYFGIKRAKEEILRLNIEICRLISFMIDDHRDFYRAVARNIITKSDLAHELSLQWEFRHKIHLQIARRLYQTSKLKDFSGTLFPGNVEGRDPVCDSHLPLPSWMESIFGMTVMHDDDMSDGEDEETVSKEIVADADLVVQLFENIDIQDNIDTRSNNII
jgi:hypothetical protein